MADGPIDAAAVEKAIDGFADPESGRSVTKFDQVKDVRNFILTGILKLRARWTSKACVFQRLLGRVLATFTTWELHRKSQRCDPTSQPKRSLG